MAPDKIAKEHLNVLCIKFVFKNIIHIIIVFGYKYHAEFYVPGFPFLDGWYLFRVLLVSGLTAAVPGTLSMEES